MRRILSFSLVLLVALSMLPVVVSADHAIHIYVNGIKLESDIAPRMIDGHTYVPIRVVADEIGAEASWTKTEDKVKLKKGDVSIEMKLGSNLAVINGSPIQLPAAPLEIDGTAMVPLRYIGGQLGVKVIWDALTKSVLIFKTSSGTPNTTKLTDRGASFMKPADLFGEDRKLTLTYAGGDQLSAVSAIGSDSEQVFIQSSGKIAPRIFYLSQPDRLVIDLPYASFAQTLNGAEPAQNGEIASAHPLVQKIRYAHFSNDPSTIRIVLDLTQPAQYEIIQQSASDAISIRIKSAVFKVVIDAGHGGRDPGATGNSDSLEKQFTLNLSAKIHQLLQKEPFIQSYMTRSDDQFLSLEERAQYANNINADAFVSVHGNTYRNDSVRGTETYYWKADSIAFADMLHKSVLSSAGLPDRKVRKAEFRVLKDTNMPSALLEIGYLSNKLDESQMLREDFQQRVAESIVKAIKDYLLSR
jgi:N-acetylmuramoyl-L-alanine amidase